MQSLPVTMDGTRWPRHPEYSRNILHLDTLFAFYLTSPCTEENASSKFRNVLLVTNKDSIKITAI